MPVVKHQAFVSDWMTPDPITGSVEMSLAEAYELMQENEIRRLLIVRDDELAGIVTLSDILRTIPAILAEADRETRLLMTSQTVRDVASRDPVTVNADETIQDAAERMLEYQVSGLPVVQGRRPVGVITESDIFRLVVESWGELED